VLTASAALRNVVPCGLFVVLDFSQLWNQMEGKKPCVEPSRLKFS